MKKVVAILLAGMLTLGASMTAFAAPSPSGSTGDTKIEASLVGQDGGEVIVSQDYPTTEDANAAAALKEDPKAGLIAVVGENDAKEMGLVQVMDVKVQGTVAPPYTIRFNVPGVTPSSKVFVLHYINGAWQKETPTLGNGTITVTFDSLSPVAIYVDQETLANVNAGGSGNGSQASDGKVSPKTGAAPVMNVAMIIAVCAAAGMAVSVRRKRA